MNRLAKMLTLLLLGTALSVFLGISAAFIWAFRATSLEYEAPDPQNCATAVVIARQRERYNEDDQSLPFRNSILAIYQKQDKSWTKISKDFRCRSTSTALEPEQFVSTYGFEGVTSTAISSEFEYGYQSIPLGFYNLRPANYKGKKAFLITEWGRKDGKISLPTQQVIRFAQVRYDGVSKIAQIVKLNKEFALGSEKSQCFLHQTSTKYWSNHDALGCITIGNKNSESGKNDWLSFFNSIPFAQMKKPDEEIGLYIGSGEALLQSRETLPFKLGFEDQAFICAN